MKHLKRLSDTALCEMYQQGSNAAAEELLNRYNPLVQYVARRLNWTDVDLVQVGRIGLVNGMRKFNPDKGVLLKTWLHECVLSEMRHYIRDCGRLIRLPQRVQYNPDLLEQHKAERLPLEDYDAEFSQDFSGCIVDSLLAELPQKQQSVMRGVMAGDSIYETAQKMGISNNYAFWLRNKARKKLERFYTLRLDFLITKPAIIDLPPARVSNLKKT